MELMATFLNGLQAFSLYLLISLTFLLAFKLVYPLVTPQNEWQLIKSGNIAAAIAFGGSILGFSLALASAANHSVNLLDFAKWGAVALLAQCIAFVLVRFFTLRDIQKRLENNDIAAGVVMGLTSVSVGVLNAACMSY